MVWKVLTPGGDDPRVGAGRAEPHVGACPDQEDVVRFRL